MNSPAPESAAPLLKLEMRCIRSNATLETTDLVFNVRNLDVVCSGVLNLTVKTDRNPFKINECSEVTLTDLGPEPDKSKHQLAVVDGKSQVEK